MSDPRPERDELSDQEFERESAEFRDRLREGRETRSAVLDRDPADTASLAEAAAALGLTAEQVQDAIADGSLPSVTVGGDRRVTVGALRAFRDEDLARRRQAADAIAELSNELGLDE